MRDAVFPAEGDHLLQALDTQLRLFRSRLVVEAGMQDTAVIPGLMGGQLRFLFHEHEAQPRTGLQQPIRSGQPHDTASDNNDVLSHTLQLSGAGGAG